MVDYFIPTDKAIAERTCQLILEDLSRNWSMAALARENHLTVFTLRRIFKRQRGQTITDFTAAARIARAKELLTTTQQYPANDRRIRRLC